MLKNSAIWRSILLKQAVNLDPGHPLYRFSIGNTDSLKRETAQRDVATFYKKMYSLDKLTVVTFHNGKGADFMKIFNQLSMQEVQLDIGEKNEFKNITAPNLKENIFLVLESFEREIFSIETHIDIKSPLFFTNIEFVIQILAKILEKNLGGLGYLKDYGVNYYRNFATMGFEIELYKAGKHSLGEFFLLVNDLPILAKKFITKEIFEKNKNLKKGEFLLQNGYSDPFSSMNDLLENNELFGTQRMFSGNIVWENFDKKESEKILEDFKEKKKIFTYSAKFKTNKYKEEPFKQLERLLTARLSIPERSSEPFLQNYYIKERHDKFGLKYNKYTFGEDLYENLRKRITIANRVDYVEDDIFLSKNFMDFLENNSQISVNFFLLRILNISTKK